MSSRGWKPDATSWRRLVQLIFLGLFFYLLLAARLYPGSSGADPWWKLFFLIDPLVTLVTSLATHTVVQAGLWAVVIVALTLIMGRVFCGWICPLGTIHALAGRFLFWIWPDRKRRDHWSPWQRTKYFLLIGALVMALFGGHWVCIFDPLVLLYRTTTTAILPNTQWALEEGSTAVFKADPRIGPLRVTSITDPPYAWLRDHFFVLGKQAFLGSQLILAFFVVTLLANRYRPRFWCRYLCPLGALLGVFAWRPLLRRTVDPQQCNQCDLCAMACHGAAAAAPGDQWKAAECFGCLNCTATCRRQSLTFTWTWPWRKEPKSEGLDLSRRASLAAMLGGVGTLGLLRSTPQGRGKLYHDALIRPPGARPERAFLQRCTSCGLCMKVCPTGGLQPTLLEAGLEGLWTPHLVARIGQCEYNCNLCGQVCPTEAIMPLSVPEKQKIHIGLAAFDITRCIPYAYQRDCMVCEEHCPIGDKAIFFVEVELVTRSGEKKKVKQPHVDPVLCVGCGICENVCPLRDRPGVRVFSANETRHPDNQPLLPESDAY